MTSDMRFAEFIDRCCGRFVSDAQYRRKLKRELEKPAQKRTTGRKVA